MTAALDGTKTRSILMSFSAKKLLLMPMKTGHRLADAEPTVPTTTVSAAWETGVTATAQVYISPYAAARKDRDICMMPSILLSGGSHQSVASVSAGMNRLSTDMVR